MRSMRSPARARTASGSSPRSWPCPPGRARQAIDGDDVSVVPEARGSSTVDSVADAQAASAAAPAAGRRKQPYQELGLTDGEYASIVALLGRRPTDAELAIYSVMWSEHCSYKSSRAHLRQFADKAPASSALLAGIGQNAGVVDIGQ